MNKKGFISVSIIYSFLILFLILLLGILSTYVQRENMIDKIVIQVKADLE